MPSRYVWSLYRIVGIIGGNGMYFMCCRKVLYSIACNSSEYMSKL